MLPLTLKEIANLIEGKLIGENDTVISSVVIDSRQVVHGSLFVAIQGERVDGHDFVQDALAKGAVGAIVSRDLNIENTILVNDSIKAIQLLAHKIRIMSSVKVVAITGSTGKTTTKDLVASVLTEKYSVIKTEGNFNNELGLPLTLLRIEPQHQVVVLEMGMRGFGEIDFLCTIAKPDFAIITNIGFTHAEILGSQIGIANAKSEILSHIPSNGAAFLNIEDEDLLLPLIYKSAGQVIWYGISDNCDYYANDIIDKGLKGIHYSLMSKENEKQLEIIISLPGKHNVANSLATIAVARRLGLDWEKIKEGIKKAKLTSMRLEVIESSKGFEIINDAYNANPTSMAAALDILKNSGFERRKIAVLGNMYELGAYSESGHFKVGEIAAEIGLTYLVTVGELAKGIAIGAKSTGSMDETKIINFDNNKKAIDFLCQIIKPGDLILIKGSRGLKMEQIVQELK